MSTESNHHLAIDTDSIRKAKLLVRAINHKLRQQILHLLNKNNELSVTEIYTRLHLEQSVASQHLAILRKARFVQTRRDGKTINYRPNHDRIHEFQATALKLLTKP